MNVAALQQRKIEKDTRILTAIGKNLSLKNSSHKSLDQEKNLERRTNTCENMTAMDTDIIQNAEKSLKKLIGQELAATRWIGLIRNLEVDPEADHEADREATKEVDSITPGLETKGIVEVHIAIDNTDTAINRKLNNKKVSIDANS